MTAWIRNLRLGRLAAAALLACLATALLAASAPAKPTPTANARAAALQKGVDGLVATGVPGAILFVRDGNSTLRLAAGFTCFTLAKSRLSPASSVVSVPPCNTLQRKVPPGARTSRAKSAAASASAMIFR